MDRLFVHITREEGFVIFDHTLTYFNTLPQYIDLYMSAVSDIEPKRFCDLINWQNVLRKFTLDIPERFIKQSLFMSNTIPSVKLISVHRPSILEYIIYPKYTLVLPHTLNSFELEGDTKTSNF